MSVPLLPEGGVEVWTRLRGLREEKGLTQERLAELVDVTRQTILFL